MADVHNFLLRMGCGHRTQGQLQLAAPHRHPPFKSGGGLFTDYDTVATKWKSVVDLRHAELEAATKLAGALPITFVAFFPLCPPFPPYSFNRSYNNVDKMLTKMMAACGARTNVALVFSRLSQNLLTLLLTMLKSQTPCSMWPSLQSQHAARPPFLKSSGSRGNPCSPSC